MSSRRRVMPVWVKVTALFSGMILVGSVVTILAIDAAANRAFERHVDSSDRERAISLAPLFEDYYGQTGGWAGIESLLAAPGRGPSTARMGMRGTMAGPAMAGAMFPIALTGPGGEVVAANVRVEGLPDEAGVVLTSSGRPVGRLYVGSMISGGLTIEEHDFLRALRTNVLVLTVISFLIAAALGGYLVFRATRPIREITRGAGAIAEGDLGARVPEHGNDDLTALSRSFNRMAEVLEDNDETRKRFVADAAHELKTPVSVLKANLEMMLDGLYPMDREQLEKLDEELSRIERLTAELGELAVAEGGADALDRSSVDPAEILAAAAQRFAGAAERKSIILRVLPIQGHGANRIEADRDRLDVLFTNLVSNALRFTPEGGSIDLSLEETRTEVIYRVDDSGPGIPDADRSRVFDRFYRTDESRTRNTGGSGLGLAIAKQVVVAHGGSIRAATSPLGGARIEVALPTIALYPHRP